MKFYSTIYLNTCNEIYIHCPLIGNTSMDIRADVIRMRLIQRQINLSKLHYWHYFSTKI